MNVSALAMTILSLAALGFVFIFAQRIVGNLAARAGV